MSEKNKAKRSKHADKHDSVKKKTRAPKRPRDGLPSKDEILSFIRTTEGPTGKREIGRAFGIKGAARIDLKRILKEMAEAGMIDRGAKRRVMAAGELPPVCLLEITGRDADGEMLARPVTFEGPGEIPAIVIAPGKADDTRGEPAGVGDRVLARLKRIEDENFAYEARIIKRVMEVRAPLLGVFRLSSSGEAMAESVDKKARHDYRVSHHDTKDAQGGELVLLEALSSTRFGPQRARVIERLGKVDSPRAVSLIAIHAHGIPNHFPPEVLHQAEEVKEATIKGRVDLTQIPLITIDPKDARDHDDAVWAAPDDAPANKGGFRLLVAIADVSAYVRPGSALDKEAQRRGNSVYFPDRVVPMLPERISNDLCSLRPREMRPALAVEIIIDAQGARRSYKFMRAMIRSAEKLTYEEAQAAIDAHPNEKTAPLLEPVLKPLYAAYGALAKARDARQPLNLDLPERRIVLDEEGKVASITIPERLDAHKLIEEFMIAANVCAAEQLKEKKTPLLYRIHEPPSAEKIAALQEFLATINIPLAKGQNLRPQDFNKILENVAGGEFAAMVNEVTLRSQTQAYYGPANLGHFGLNLRNYAHFTSPIRRYADLIVHRGLIRALGMGDDGLPDMTIPELEKLGENISLYERRAMTAERDTIDRYMAAYMSEHIGSEFQGRIAGVTRFGLFVKLNDTGADGIIPIRTLPNDYYIHDENAHALIGERTGQIFRLGAPVTVKVVEAVPVRGGLRFELMEGGEAGTGAVKTPGSHKGRRQPNRRGPGKAHQRGKKNHPRKHRPDRKTG